MSLIFVLAACNDDNADYTSDSSQSEIIEEEKTDVVISVNQATDAEEETTEEETTEEETTEEETTEEETTEEETTEEKRRKISEIAY